MSDPRETPSPAPWDPDRYAANARFVSDLGAPLLDLLAARPGERILDLGCGDGVLALRLAERGAEVVGADSSPEFVAAARARGIDARLIDGRALGFEAEFDAVFSNAALHWMRDPDAVIAGVHRALRPRGRFVAECGGGANVAAIVGALEAALERRGIDPAPHNPWYFPGAAEYRARLEVHGFTVRHLELFERPTPLPGDILGWLETFAGTFTAALPAGGAEAFLREVRDALRPRLCDSQGLWVADYVRLRFCATRN